MAKDSFKTFDDLVSAAWRDPAAEAELRRRYETTAAILVVDFTGMVHRSDANGIIYALSLARAAERELAPSIQAHGGTLVKRVADTVFAVFSQPLSALLAALDSQRALDTFNRDRNGSPHDGQRNDPIHGSIGLGWGPTLVLPGQDIYGAEVNRAFVLGEDIGQAGEVLTSEAFWAAIGTPPPGIGSHRAPAQRVEEAGFGFHLVSDHRE